MKGSKGGWIEGDREESRGLVAHCLSTGKTAEPGQEASNGLIDH